jgi:hypothetical protein
MGGFSLGGHNHYDQMAFFPGATQEFNEQIGPFDFANVVFRALWDPPSVLWARAVSSS